MDPEECRIARVAVLALARVAEGGWVIRVEPITTVCGLVGNVAGGGLSLASWAHRELASRREPGGVSPHRERHTRAVERSGDPTGGWRLHAGRIESNFDPDPALGWRSLVPSVRRLGNNAIRALLNS